MDRSRRPINVPKYVQSLVSHIEMSDSKYLCSAVSEISTLNIFNYDRGSLWFCRRVISRSPRSPRGRPRSLARSVLIARSSLLSAARGNTLRSFSDFERASRRGNLPFSLRIFIEKRTEEEEASISPRCYLRLLQRRTGSVSIAPAVERSLPFKSTRSGSQMPENGEGRGTGRRQDELGEMDPRCCSWKLARRGICFRCSAVSFCVGRRTTEPKRTGAKRVSVWDPFIRGSLAWRNEKENEREGERSSERIDNPPDWTDGSRRLHQREHRRRNYARRIAIRLPAASERASNPLRRYSSTIIRWVAISGSSFM